MIFYIAVHVWRLLCYNNSGGKKTKTNKKKRNTKKKSFTIGEWGLSKWKCTWCVFVSVSAVSCWSDHAGAEVSVCSLSQVYCVFHVVEAVVRFVVRCQWGDGVSRACLCLVIVLLYVGVNSNVSSVVSVLLGRGQGGIKTSSQSNAGQVDDEAV